MLSPKEARILSNNTLECPWVEQLNLIEDEIIKESKKCHTSMQIFLDNIYLGTINKLKELGYKVRCFDDRLDISWDE